MDWLSLLILVFVGIAGFMGLRQGLVRQVLGLAGLIAAVVLGLQYYDRMGTVLLEYFVIPRSMANILGFAAVCVGVGLAVWLMESAWGRIVRYTPVSLLDAIGGALFGLAKGAVIIAIALLVLYALPLEGVRTAIDRSVVAREFLEVSPVIYGKIEEYIPVGIPRFLERGDDGEGIKGPSERGDGAMGRNRA